MSSSQNSMASCWSFTKSYRGRATIIYAAAFGLLGIALASLGPTLVYLAEQTDTELADLGFLFPARSVAYLIGSAAGGPVFDRFPGHIVLSVSMFLTSIGTAVIPFCSNVALLIVCVGLQGLSMGFLDTGGNVSLVWLHGGDKVPPFMQLIHFAFGLGAFVSPLLIELSLELMGSYRWSFWLMAMLFVPAAVSIMLIPSPKPAVESKAALSRKRTKREIVLIFIGASILALYVGTELAMGGYIYSYFVEYLHRSGTEGDFLTSTFWGALAFGRLIAIPISVYISARTMLLVNMFFSAISIVALWIFTGVVELVWVCVAIFGLFMASTYPSVLNMLEKYVNLSGKITSVLVVGGALGEMLIPLILAFIFQEPDHWSDLIDVLSIVSIVNFFQLLLFIWIGRVIVIDGYSYLGSKSLDVELASRDVASASISTALEDAVEYEEEEVDDELGKSAKGKAVDWSIK